MDRSKHADELAAQHGLVIRREMHVRKGSTSGGIPKVRGNIVICGGTDSDKGYFTALHEIGHRAIGDYGSGSDKLLREEADAWAWAVANALFKPSADIKRFIGECLASYHAKALRCPEKGHKFWEMLAWKDTYKPRRKVRERRLP